MGAGTIESSRRFMANLREIHVNHLKVAGCGAQATVVLGSPDEQSSTEPSVSFRAALSGGSKGFYHGHSKQLVLSPRAECFLGDQKSGDADR
jgi:hypothetical protein